MAERTDDLTRDAERESADGDGDIDETVDAGEGIDPDELGVDASVFDRATADDGDIGVEGTTVENEGSLSGSESSRTGRVKRRAASVFAPATFVVHLAVALVGVFVLGGLVPVLPSAIAGFVGLLVMTGLLGTLSSEPRYLEAAVAGGASGALAFFLWSIGLSVVTGGLLPLAGAGVGALVALAGFYAGRDARDGLTKDL